MIMSSNVSTFDDKGRCCAQDSAKEDQHNIPSTPTFPFRKLPAEIRDEIYAISLTCCSDTKIKTIHKYKNPVVVEEWMPDRFFHNDPSLQVQFTFTIDVEAERPDSYFNTSLIFVSRLLHHEAIPVLYSKNRFRFRGECQWLDPYHFQRRLSATDNLPFRIIAVDLQNRYTVKNGSVCLCGSRTSMDCILKVMKSSSKIWDIHVVKETKKVYSHDLRISSTSEYPRYQQDHI